jgi:endonuclease/exonuclease/phosphatase family metal-dependent hydrolase
MLRHPRILAVLAILALASACGQEAPGQAGSSTALAGGKWGEAPPDHSNAGGSKYVTVMTRNLYLGADINRIIFAAVSDPASVPQAVSAAWATVQATDFPARAKLIADEIEQTQPDLIGLQELTLWQVGTITPSGVVFTPVYDFLTILEEELANRGLAYETVSIAKNFEGAVPDATGTIISITDRDGILARKGTMTANSASGSYPPETLVTFSTSIPGLEQLVIKRGWASTEVEIQDRWFKYYTTHLEEEIFPDAQVAQANEFIGMLGADTLPVIATGDFNAGPEIVANLHVPTYTNLLAAGLVDSWARLEPKSPGFSCCFDEGLKSGELTTRIDLTFLQGPLKPVAAEEVGLSAFTPSGLRPSDHAGFVTKIRLKNLHSSEGAGR